MSFWKRLANVASEALPLRGERASAALLAQRDSIRDVIAFPKAASGVDPLTGAPAAVDERQLRELGLKLDPGASS